MRNLYKPIKISLFSVWIASFSSVGLMACTSEISETRNEESRRVVQHRMTESRLYENRETFGSEQPRMDHLQTDHHRIAEAPIVSIPPAPAYSKPIAQEALLPEAVAHPPVAMDVHVPAQIPASATPKPKETVKPIRIPVLNYHSIGTDPGNNAVLEPSKLEEQMAYLAKEGYTTLTLRQFIEIWEGRQGMPPKTVLLTFDDGYADNHEKALPILRKHGFHATMFMSPGSVGDGWYIDWQQAKELQEAGWDIQPHGMTHPYLNRMPVEQARAEIEQAAQLIEEHLGIKAEVFCYPYGAFNKDTMQILKDNQYKLAFTIEQGYSESTQNPLALKRLFIGGSDSLNTFIHKLTKS